VLGGNALPPARTVIENRDAERATPVRAAARAALRAGRDLSSFSTGRANPLRWHHVIVAADTECPPARAVRRLSFGDAIRAGHDELAPCQRARAFQARPCVRVTRPAGRVAHEISPDCERARERVAVRAKPHHAAAHESASLLWRRGHRGPRHAAVHRRAGSTSGSCRRSSRYCCCRWR